VKTLRTLTLSLVAVLVPVIVTVIGTVVVTLVGAVAASALIAGPVAAATPTPALAAAKPWHYWVSFLLLASFALVVVALLVGYYVKVIRASRGR